MKTYEKVDANNLKVIEVTESRTERVETVDSLIEKRAVLQQQIDEIDALLLAAHDVGIEKATGELQSAKEKLTEKADEFRDIPAK